MHRYTVELRIVGSNLDPEEVTRTIGLSPTQVRKKGERRSAESTWANNMWALEALPPDRSEWSSLADGLAALLGAIRPVQDRLRNYTSGNDLYIWCGHFASSFGGGPTLSPVLLKMLGDLGAQLVLDTYFEPPDS